MGQNSGASLFCLTSFPVLLSQFLIENFRRIPFPNSYFSSLNDVLMFHFYDNLGILVYTYHIFLQQIKFCNTDISCSNILQFKYVFYQYNPKRKPLKWGLAKSCECFSSQALLWKIDVAFGRQGDSVSGNQRANVSTASGVQESPEFTKDGVYSFMLVARTLKCPQWLLPGILQSVLHFGTSGLQDYGIGSVLYLKSVKLRKFQNPRGLSIQNVMEFECFFSAVIKHLRSFNAASSLLLLLLCVYK